MPTNKRSHLDLLSSYSNEFHSKLRRINSFTNHPTSIGTSHEGILRRFLQQYLPKRFTVSEGFIVGKDDNVSSQCDILIWSSLDYSPYYSDGDFVIVPADSVHAVIEVKTSLGNSSMQDGFKQLKPIHEMNNKIYTAIFAFESSSLRACLENIVYDLDVEVANSVDSVCVLDKWSLHRLGLVLTDKPGLGMLGTPQANKRDYGTTGNVIPLVLVLPPADDPGFDLVSFLGFLFSSLELKSNPVIELLYDAPVFLDSPIIPGIGKGSSEDAFTAEFKTLFEKFWQAVEATQNAKS